MEKERFDGGDITHLIRAHGKKLNWEHLISRFGPNWRVLYSHIVTFGFVYPQELKVSCHHFAASLNFTVCA